MQKDRPRHPDAPLPDILGVAPPEHGVLGRILILLIYACAVWVMAFAAIAPIREGYPLGGWLAFAAMGAVACAALMYLAEGVRRFRCWAWFFVGGLLALPLPGVVFILMSPMGSLTEDVTSFGGGMMLSGGLRYLWQQRWEFWMDARLDARFQAPRAASAAWCSARRARLATVVPRRPAAPVAGTLWERRRERRR